jgi:hypothetical protein
MMRNIVRFNEARVQIRANFDYWHVRFILIQAFHFLLFLKLKRLKASKIFRFKKLI